MKRGCVIKFKLKHPSLCLVLNTLNSNRKTEIKCVCLHFVMEQTQWFLILCESDEFKIYFCIYTIIHNIT